MNDYLKSADLCKKILAEDPANFDATWKCARGLRYYANKAQQTNTEGWEKICAQYGKEGMEYAQKAIDLQPEKPHGYYFFALNVGIYADGVSIFTALKEGLKDKTQSSFEKVLALDPAFESAGAVLGVGRFWSVLPWPLADKDKAMEYYRQYQATEYFGKYPEGIVYISELLIDMGGKKNKAEARDILAKLNTDNKYFKDWAEKLSSEL
jgi:tetratricopeptide (TPR) repeat protein